MTDTSLQKSMTRKVVIADPNEELLEMRLEGRTLSPELFRFLKNLVKTKKWTKNITIPSTSDDVAVALLFASSLKESGLEILSEIHVFYAGRKFVETWEMLPESEPPTSLPPKIFGSMDVRKVRVMNSSVCVEIMVYLADGRKKRVLKTYDFSHEEPTVQTRQLAEGEEIS